MALPSSTTQRENEKFVEDAGGNVAVRTTSTLEAGDIEIGAVEIKDATSSTRAAVGSDGLHVDVQATVLPTDAATEDKQDDIITAINEKQSDIASYQTNDIDDGDTTTDVVYIGLEKDDGTWCMKKIDETTSALPTFQYATVANNVGTTNYSDAFTNRATLTYQDYQLAF